LVHIILANHHMIAVLFQKLKETDTFVSHEIQNPPWYTRDRRHMR